MSFTHNDRPSRRAAYDFYPTPPEATRALLSVERFGAGAIWEPACGDGAISKVLITARYRVHSTDLINRGFGLPSIDFLRQLECRGVHIVTNPPYGSGLADEFVMHALYLTRRTGGSVAMLLNWSSVGNPRRLPLWREYPPTAVYVLGDIVFYPNGKPIPYGRIHGRHYHCWVVWHRRQRPTPTTLQWLDTAPFREP